jgi:UDP-N-acetylmuramyl pentapeptide phosphotransferase/UDP-N-acetylglucosamine-1-phosphate transferase
MGGYLFVFIAVLAASYAGTGLALRLLRERAILDHPNERSSHATATPRGGGIAVIAVLLAAWAGISLFTIPVAMPAPMVPVLVAAGSLALVSWLDDLRGVAPALRLLIQIAAATTALGALPGLVFQGVLPPELDWAATVLIWVWFINLFNFMDGIDGIAGVETAAIGLGLFLIGVIFAEPIPGFTLYALSLVAAALGFLRWNWAPAKIFLGDVGSAPLGFLLGYLLLSAAAAGHWVPALILPLYYLADSGITLGQRLVRGEKIWQAHASHFYQHAARALGSHGAVVRAIAVADALLIILALAAARGFAAGAMACAVLVTAALLVYLARRTGTES